MVKITDVLPKSRAEKAGLIAGDCLLQINGKDINDVLDYRFYLANKEIDLSVTRNGQPLSFHIVKKEYDDIGLDFETPLMDKKHSCENKCVFCFIDQLPRGMRKTLYFKDDDSRLSFLHGNYVTLTNMHDSDIQRIIDMHISPVNVSVHTTNPELRRTMMHNKRAGDVLAYLRRMADAGISLCCQIVLCKGLNDGEELDRSMRDLSELFPAMQSVSIVPAGLTRFREKLYPLEGFTKEESAAVIAQVDKFAKAFEEKNGSRMFFCSDEFYLKAELPLPEESYYEGYPQIENGVGMITSLVTEFKSELDYLDEYLENYKAPRHISIATGVAAYDTIKAMAVDLEARIEGLQIDVYKIINHFFGETITVSGLLTGKDISEQLSGKNLGDLLIFPSNALRSGEDVFLDDMTPTDLSAALGVPVSPSKEGGEGFICDALGVEHQI